MSKIITPVANASSFENWVAATNTLINVASKTVTVESNTIGDTTTGNGYVNGVFGAANLVGITLSGGTVGSPSTLTIISNTSFSQPASFTGIVNVTANVRLVANSIVIAGNSTSNVITVSSNSTSADLIIAGNNAFVNSNLIANGAFIANSTITLNGVTTANNVTVNGVLTANSTAQFNSTTTVSGILNTAITNINGNLVSNAAAIFNSSVTAGSTVHLNGVTTANTLTVSGAFVASANINLNGDAIANNLTVVGTFAANAVSTLAGGIVANTIVSLTSIIANTTLDVHGATTANSITAGGIATFNSNVIVAATGTLLINGPTISNNNVTIAGTTNLGGTTTAGIVNINGALTANSTTNLVGQTTTKAVTINGALVVNSTSIFVGTVTTNGLTVNGTLTGNTVTATSLTVGGSAVWTAGNDGPGSGLNADLLDGNDSTYFAPLASPGLSGVPTAPTAANTTNTTQLATTAFVQNVLGATYTAADILTKIKTVDGAGSGLDADLLDGQSSAFYAPIASPTFTGVPSAPTAVAGTNTTQLATTAFVAALGALKADVTNPVINGSLKVNGDINAVRAGNTTGAVFFGNTNSKYLFFDGTGFVLSGGGLTVNGGTAWSSVNDGSGSGLDADLLDGNQSTAFAKLATAENFTAAQRVTISALTDGATITPNFNLSNYFTVTLAGNRTLANPSNITAGQMGSIEIKQDATGSRTLSYGTFWKFPGGTAPALTTGASKVDRLDYFVTNSTFIHASLAQNLS